MMKNHKMFHKDTPLFIPIDSDFECVDIIYDDVIIKNRQLCPIIVPFVCKKIYESTSNVSHYI